MSRKLNAAIRSKSEGTPIPGDLLTVEQLLESWLRERASKRVRPSTFRSYEVKCRLHIIPAIGKVRIAKLTPRRLERLLNDLVAGGVSPQSASHIRAVPRNALNTAMRWGLIGRNVAALVDAPTVPKREIKALTVSNAKAILDAVTADRLEGLFAIALAVGLRQSEALALQWSDIDLEGGSLRVERVLQRVGGEYRFFDPKNDSSRRTVPLPRELRTALHRHRARQLEERLKAGSAWQSDEFGDLVFTDEVGTPLSGYHVTRQFRKLLEGSGLASMRYHDLRHGATSLMAALGVPVRVAMEILGHAQISTTMNIYAHVAPEYQRDAMERVVTAISAES